MMMLDRYKLVIFDWDGTLSTSTSIVRAARFTKLRYSLQDIEKNVHLYKQHEVEDNIEVEEINRFYALIFDLYSVFAKPKLKDGVIDMLKSLKKKGKKIAIFSDSNRYRLYSETRKLGVRKYADWVLSADSIKKFKPNPSGILAIIRRYNMKKKDCIYLGDMAADVYTARFAGIDACAIADGVDPYSLLKSVRPRYLKRNLNELLKGKS